MLMQFEHFRLAEHSSEESCPAWRGHHLQLRSRLFSECGWRWPPNAQANAATSPEASRLPVALHQRDMLRLATIDGARVEPSGRGGQPAGKQSLTVLDMRSPHSTVLAIALQPWFWALGLSMSRRSSSGVKCSSGMKTLDDRLPLC
jgi:hypothetical protein